MTAPARLTLLSIVPALQGLKGHVHGYQMSLGRAAAANAWTHHVALPRGHGLDALPPGWSEQLPPAVLDLGLPGLLRQGRWRDLFGGIGEFARATQAAIEGELQRGAGECAVFLESFNGPQLLGVFLALRRVDRSRLRAWILFRQEPQAMGWHARLYLAVTRRAARLFAPGRFRILADSEPLAQSLSAAFAQRVAVMPIPHTDLPPGPAFARSAGEVICWWPGSARPEKGLAAIRRLAAAGPSWEGPGRLRLVVSEAAAAAATATSFTLQAVPDVLTGEAYATWMRTADIVLLPYSAGRYRASTSGIFVECIAAGKIPLVSPATWMASELVRFGLGELVLDWDSPQLAARIMDVADSPRLQDLLAAMRASYLAFHNEASYARELAQLIEPSLR